MENFINRNQGNKEPGIIIVENQQALLPAVDLLIGYGFYFAQNVEDAISRLKQSQKICISEDEIKSDTANFYNLMHGVSTGTFENIDIVFSEDFNFIVVVTRPFIESESNDGRDWLAIAGLTLQFTE